LVKPTVNRTKQELLDFLVPLLQHLDFFKERQINQEADLLEIAKCLTFESFRKGSNVFDWGKRNRSLAL
jgi:hypothetical protein